MEKSHSNVTNVIKCLREELILTVIINYTQESSHLNMTSGIKSFGKKVIQSDIRENTVERFYQNVFSVIKVSSRKFIMLFTREYIVEKSPLNESFFKYFSLSPGKILERSQCDESLILKSNLVSQQKMHKGEKPLRSMC